MDITSLIQTASKVGTPLALSGMAITFLFLVLKQMLSLEVFRQLSSAATERVFKKVINASLIIALICIFLGFLGFISPLLLPFLHKVDESDSDLSYSERVHYFRTALKIHGIAVSKYRIFPPSGSIKPNDAARKSGNGLSPIVVTADYPGAHCEKNILWALTLSEFLSEFYYRPVGLYIGHINLPKSLFSHLHFRRDFLSRWVPSDNTSFDILDEDEFREFADGLKAYYKYFESGSEFSHSNFTYVFNSSGEYLTSVPGQYGLNDGKTLIRATGRVLYNSLAYNPGAVRRSLLYPELNAEVDQASRENFKKHKPMHVNMASLSPINVNNGRKKIRIGLLGLGSIDAIGAFENIERVVSSAVPRNPHEYYYGLFAQPEGVFVCA